MGRDIIDLRHGRKLCGDFHFFDDVEQHRMDFGRDFDGTAGGQQNLVTRGKADEGQQQPNSACNQDADTYTLRPMKA